MFFPIPFNKGKIRIAAIALALSLLCGMKAMAAEQYVLSRSGQIAVYELRAEKLVKASDIIDVKEFVNSHWPSLARSQQLLVFEGRLVSDPNSSWILSVPMPAEKQSQPSAYTKIAKGYLPSLSPDGRLLSYVSVNGTLTIQEISGGNVLGAIENVQRTHPAVWLSDDTVVYNNSDGRMMSYNLSDEASTEYEFTRLVPVVRGLNPDEVICGDFAGQALSIINLHNGQSRELIHGGFLSVGYGVVMRPGQNGFLYEQQTWSNLLRLSESFSIFAADWSGESVKVMDRGALSGGVSLSSQ